MVSESRRRYRLKQKKDKKVKKRLGKLQIVIYEEKEDRELNEISGRLSASVEEAAPPQPLQQQQQQQPQQEPLSNKQRDDEEISMPKAKDRARHRSPSDKAYRRKQNRNRKIKKRLQKRQVNEIPGLNATVVRVDLENGEVGQPQPLQEQQRQQILRFEDEVLGEIPGLGASAQPQPLPQQQQQQKQQPLSNKQHDDEEVSMPKDGDGSYSAEENGGLPSLAVAEHAKPLEDAFNSLEGVTCDKAEEGEFGMYLYPYFHFSRKAIKAAEAANTAPDVYYAKLLLRATGIIIAPGIDSGKAPGIWGMGLKVRLEDEASRLTGFHQAFIAEFHD